MHLDPTRGIYISGCEIRVSKMSGIFKISGKNSDVRVISLDIQIFWEKYF